MADIFDELTATLPAGGGPTFPDVYPRAIAVNPLDEILAQITRAQPVVNPIASNGNGDIFDQVTGAEGAPAPSKEGGDIFDQLTAEQQAPAPSDPFGIKAAQAYGQDLYETDPSKIPTEPQQQAADINLTGQPRGGFEDFWKGLNVSSVPREVIESLTPAVGGLQDLKRTYETARDIIGGKSYQDAVKEHFPETQTFVGIEQKPLRERIATGIDTVMQLIFAKEAGEGIPIEPGAGTTGAEASKEPVREELQPKGLAPDQIQKISEVERRLKSGEITPSEYDSTVSETLGPEKAKQWPTGEEVLSPPSSTAAPAEVQPSPAPEAPRDIFDELVSEQAPPPSALPEQAQNLASQFDELQRQGVDIQSRIDALRAAPPEAPPVAPQDVAPAIEPSPPAPTTRVIPSLGDTGKEIYQGMIEAAQRPPPRARFVAQVVGGPAFDFRDGKPVVLEDRGRTFRDPTSAEVQELHDAIDKGTLQAEYRSTTGGTISNWTRAESPEDYRLLHQATGRPLEEVAPPVEAGVSPAEAPSLLDVPDSRKYLAQSDLSPAQQDQVWRKLLQEEQAERKAGTVQGARGFETSQIDAHVENFLETKRNKAADDAAFRKASSLAPGNEKIANLLQILNDAQGQLASIQAKRGMYGVQWAEKNVRSRATDQKQAIRKIKDRLIAEVKGAAPPEQPRRLPPQPEAPAIAPAKNDIVTVSLGGSEYPKTRITNVVETPEGTRYQVDVFGQKFVPAEQIKSIDQPAPAPVVEATPDVQAQVEKVIRETKNRPDTAPAKMKVQKAYLLDALNTAHKAAPEEAPTSPEHDADLSALDATHYSIPGYYDMSQPDKEAAVATAKATKQALFDKYGVENEGDKADSNLREAITNARGKALPKITIEVPGDGTFEIVNSKEAIAQFRDAARKRFPTTTLRPDVPTTGGRTTEAAIGAVSKKAPTREDLIKILGQAASTDPDRAVLQSVASTGNELVATDGRRLIRVDYEGPKINVEGKGKKKGETKPAIFDIKTLKRDTAKEKDSIYPNWKQVVPDSSKLGSHGKYTTADTGSLMKLITQAEQVMGEKTKSVKLWMDDKGKLGITASSPDVGEFAGGDANPNTAKVLGAYNPQFLKDGLRMARQLGHEKVDLYLDKKSTDLSPLSLQAKGMEYVLMPMRISDSGSLAPIGERAAGAHPMITDPGLVREKGRADVFNEVRGGGYDQTIIEMQKRGIPTDAVQAYADKVKAALISGSERPSLKAFDDAIRSDLEKWNPDQPAPYSPTQPIEGAETPAQTAARAAAMVERRRASYRDALAQLPDGTKIGRWEKRTLGQDVMWLKDNKEGTPDVLNEVGQKAADKALTDHGISVPRPEGGPSSPIAEQGTELGLGGTRKPETTGSPWSNERLQAAKGEAGYVPTTELISWAKSRPGFQEQVARYKATSATGGEPDAVAMEEIAHRMAYEANARTATELGMGGTRKPRQTQPLTQTVAPNTTPQLAQTITAKMPGMGNTFAEIKNGLLQLVLPSARSAEHLRAAETLGAKLGQMHRRAEIASAALTPHERMFDRLGVDREGLAPADNVGAQFASAMSTGEPVPKGTSHAADMLKQQFDSRLKALRDAGAPLQAVRENYFPGMWTRESRLAFNAGLEEAMQAGVIPREGFNVNEATPDQRAWVKARVDDHLAKGEGSEKDMLPYLSRNPLRGKETFRKPKVFDDIMDAQEFGLRPASNNPIRLGKVKLAEMDRSVMAHQYFSDLKNKGLLKITSPYEKAPEGWTRINDPYGTIYGPPTVQLHEYVDQAVYQGLHDLAEKLGISHERGYGIGGTRLGYSVVGGNRIVTRYATETSVLAHELGHQLDERYGLWDRLEVPTKYGAGKTDVEKDLRAIADLTGRGKYARKKVEKMAQVIEAYVHAPEKMKEVAPTVFERFDNFVRSTPAIKELADIAPGIKLQKLTSEKYVGLPIMGYRVVPEAHGDILNNYLSSSLYNNKYLGALYKGWMGGASALNQAQLGVGSAFHVGFTSADVQVSAGAKMLKDIYGVLRGNRSIPDAISSAAKTATAIVHTPILGDKVLNEWRNPKAALDSKIVAVTRAAELAGGGFHMERGLRTEQADKVRSDWYSGHKLRAALRSPVAATELMAKPIMEYLVPRQKAGVFAELASRIIEQNPGKSLEELTPQFRQAWNRVDARLGQVMYDRLFINNVAKNVMQGTLRAPGWTGGTIAELGGAFPDTYRFFKEWAATGRPPAELPDRVAYTASLLMGTMIANGALTYAFTGQQPNGMDFFAFRDGGKDDNGNETRMVLPTYMKDILAYMRAPLHTLAAKTHPLINALGELLNNKDYYGTEIRHPDDPLYKQGLQMGGYVAHQFVPFWLRGVQQQAQKSDIGFGRKYVAPYFGVMPAAKAITQSAAESEAADISHAHSAVGGRTAEEAARSQARHQAIRDIAAHVTTATQERRAGHLLPGQEGEARHLAHMTPLQRRIFGFGAEDSVRVWNKANETERGEIYRMVRQKIDNSKILSKPRKLELLRMIGARPAPAPVAPPQAGQSNRVLQPGSENRAIIQWIRENQGYDPDADMLKKATYIPDPDYAA